jgi:hypothetical protein
MPNVHFQKLRYAEFEFSVSLLVDEENTLWPTWYWEIESLYKALGTNECNGRVIRWAERHCQSWEGLHKEMHPDMDKSYVGVVGGIPIRSKDNKFKTRGNTGHQMLHPSVNTADAVVILTWAITARTRPRQDCLQSATCLHGCVLGHLSKMDQQLHLRVRPVSGAPVLQDLWIQKTGRSNIADLFAITLRPVEAAQICHLIDRRWQNLEWTWEGRRHELLDAFRTTKHCLCLPFPTLIMFLMLRCWDVDLVLTLQTYVPHQGVIKHM